MRLWPVQHSLERIQSDANCGQGATRSLGRRVQVLYFDPTSAQDRKSLRKASMKAIFAGPKLFVLGDESKLAAILDGNRTEADGKS